VPFKTLRDKELAQRKQAAEQRKRMLAAQAQLAQGARYYMNQDEMERRQREENSPKAARERQQKAIDRAQQPKAGSAGFGNAGIQYQKTGGVIYANNGMLIPYQPQGTDTVPAMLTPGEFVVNRQATQQHLPLLHAINDGYYQNGGVVYAEDGAFIPYRSKYHENSDQKRKAYEKEMQRRSDAREAERTRRAQYANEAERRIVENQQRMQQPAQLAAAMPQQQSQQMMMANRVNQAAQMAFNPQSFGNINQQFTILGTLLTGVNQTLTQFGAVLQGFQQPGNIAQVRGGNNGVPNGIADFIKSMNNLVQQLQNVGGQIPETINLAMQPARITVDITGAQLLASLQPTIQGLVIGQIDASMKDWVANNLDGIEPPNFGGSSSYA
jgi:hypothetical protein